MATYSNPKNVRRQSVASGSSQQQAVDTSSSPTSPAKNINSNIFVVDESSNGNNANGTSPSPSTSIKRKAPPQAATHARVFEDMIDSPQFSPTQQTQPPRATGSRLLASLQLEDRLSFGRATPPSQRRSPSPPLHGLPLPPSLHTAPIRPPYNHSSSSQTGPSALSPSSIASAITPQSAHPYPNSTNNTPNSLLNLNPNATASNNTANGATSSGSLQSSPTAPAPAPAVGSKNPFYQGRMAQVVQPPHPHPPLMHSHSYRDPPVSVSASSAFGAKESRPFTSTANSPREAHLGGPGPSAAISNASAGAQAPQKTSPPNAPFSEDEDDEDEDEDDNRGRRGDFGEEDNSGDGDVNVGNPSPVSQHQGHNLPAQNLAYYPLNIYPPKTTSFSNSNNPNLVSNAPKPGSNNSPNQSQSQNQNQGGGYPTSHLNASSSNLLLDFLHVPLPDSVSDDLDLLSSPASSAPPAPVPPPVSFAPSLGPRRQFLVQQNAIARPGSPLRHDATAAFQNQNNSPDSNAVNAGSLSTSSSPSSGTSNQARANQTQNQGQNQNQEQDTVVLQQSSPPSLNVGVKSTAAGTAAHNLKSGAVPPLLPGAVVGARGRLPTPPRNTNANASAAPATTIAKPNSNASSGTIERDLLIDDEAVVPSNASPNNIQSNRTPPTAANANANATRKAVGGPRTSNSGSGGVPGSTGSTPTRGGQVQSQPDRSLPLREDDWTQRGNGAPSGAPLHNASRTPSPSQVQSHQTQSYSSQHDSTPTQPQHARRRSQQYSPEVTMPQLHAPRAVPLIDVDFEQAYLARAGSALGGMNLGMGVGVPPYYFPYPSPAPYYQPPVYRDYPSLPEYLYYSQQMQDQEEEEEEEEVHRPDDVQSNSNAGVDENTSSRYSKGRTRGGTSPTPSSTLLPGLSLPEEETTTAQEQQQQSQQQGGRRQAKDYPSSTTNGTGSNLPAYDDYSSYSVPQRPQLPRDDNVVPDRSAPAQSHSHTHRRPQPIQTHSHSQVDRARDRSPPRKYADDALPYNGELARHQQPAQAGRKEPLTRANVRANETVNYPPGTFDAYDPVEVQHALWVLEQQRRIYQPHPQPLPPAFLNEFGRSAAGDGTKDHQAYENDPPRSPVQQQQQLQKRPAQQADTRSFNTADTNGDRAASTTSSHMYANSRRPDAPVPPTPHSAFYPSVAPTPYPLVFSPAPPISGIAGTPAPGGGSIIPRRRDFVEPALPTSTTMAAPPSPIQMQRYYPGGPRYYPQPVPSLPSTAMSSPFTGPINPFIRSHPHMGEIGVDRESVVSSPSHHPVPLMFPRRTKKTKGRTGVPGGAVSAPAAAKTGASSAANRGLPAAGTAPTGITQRGPREPPSRVQSTVPPSSDTDQLEEDDDEGELTEGREDRPPTSAGMDDNHAGIPTIALRTTPPVRDSTEDDDESDLWIEEDDDDNSRLDSELHPNYISHSIGRNQRFQEKLSELVRLFNEVDRLTDATMLLFVSQPDTSPSGTHMLPSRAIRRSAKYMQSAGAARSSFSQISSSRRRVARKRKFEAEILSAQKMNNTSASAGLGYRRGGTGGRGYGGGVDLSPTSSAAALAEDHMRKTLESIEAMASRATAQNHGGDDSGGALKTALRAMVDGLRQMKQINEEREERRRDEAIRQQRMAAQMEQLVQALSASSPSVR